MVNASLFICLTFTIYLGNDILVNGETINIKQLYDGSFKLNAPSNEITVSNLDVQGKLTVDKNLDVGGTVDGVDVTALAKDVVITGASVPVWHNSQFYTIGSVANTVSLGGTKTFNDKLTINGDISTSSHGGKRTPVISTSSQSNVEMSSGSSPDPSLIMVKSSKSQSISGNLNLNGDIKVDDIFNVPSMTTTDFDNLFNKYEYETAESTHHLKTAFNFKGALSANKLVSDNVRSRKFDEFASDAIAKVNTGNFFQSCCPEFFVYLLP